MSVDLPPGTQAEVHIPGDDAFRMREGAFPLTQAPGVQVVGVQAGRVVVRYNPGDTGSMGLGRSRWVAIVHKQRAQNDGPKSMNPITL